MMIFTRTTSAKVTNTEANAPRARGGTADASGASLSPHSLKTRDQANDETERGRLKSRRQKIIEIVRR